MKIGKTLYAENRETGWEWLSKNYNKEPEI
jgi:hypothetical protein